jgi:hypothetical protein
MHTVKSKIERLPQFQNREQVMQNTRRRRMFDSVVWAASLLFAFGLLMDSALAEDKDKGVPTPSASCKAERGDIHWQAIQWHVNRNPR